MGPPSSLAPPAPGPILLVDDEVELVGAVSSMLRAEFGEERVKATSDAQQALEWVRNEKPAVLITDVRMPQMSGLELLARVQEIWGPTPTIVITAYPAEAVAQGPRRGSFLYLPKPFSFRSLVDTVQQLEASPPASFRGAIAVSTLADLLQLYAISGNTGLMVVRSGGRRGEIWFERGQVVHSCVGDLSGFEAFSEILMWPEGSFSWQTRRGSTQTIQMSVSELMLEAYRIYDEASQRDQSGPTAVIPKSATRPPEPSPPRSATRPPEATPPRGAPRSDTTAPSARRSELPGHNNVPLALARLRHLEGFLAALLVDSETQTVLGSMGASSEFEADAVSNSELVRLKRKLVVDLALHDEIEDILITLGRAYHLIRPLRSRPGVFFYLALDRSQASLALARMTLADAEHSFAQSG